VRCRRLREERVAAPPVRSAAPLRLGKRVDREAAGAFEPALVAGACERFEEREAVARRAVAETVAFPVAVGARLPDELGSGEHEVLVDVVERAGEDTRSPGAPLEADPAVARARKLRTRRAGPVREAALAERSPRKDGSRLARKATIRFETAQGEGISGGAVQRAEAAVVVVLPPEPVVAPAGTQGCGRLARRVLPARLAGPLAHRQCDEERPGRTPADVVRRVGDVRADERMQVVRQRRIGGEPEGDEQRPGLTAEERRRVVMLIGREVRSRPLQLDRAQRGGGEVERALGVASSPQRVQRPDHAGGARVEALQRQRLLPSVPLVSRPERIAIERRVGVGDDVGDRTLDALRNPRLVDQTLELRPLVEHRCTHRFLLDG
jgi:hypothetical protein